MFKYKLQGNDRSLNNMVCKKEDDTKGNQRPFPSNPKRDENNNQDGKNGRKSGPGCQQGSGYFNIMEHGKARIDGIEDQAYIKKDHTRLCKDSIPECERP